MVPIRIQTLISTTDKKDISFLDDMNLFTDTIIVNRTAGENKNLCFLRDNHTTRFISTDSKGISKCRNIAIDDSVADICVLSNTGFSYVNDFEEIIREAYYSFPDADVITFMINKGGERKKSYLSRSYKHNIFTILSADACEITFKRDSISRTCLSFREEFGHGSVFEYGECPLFLYDCLERDLNVYYVPVTIGEYHENKEESFGTNYFISYGAVLRVIGGIFGSLYNFFFTVSNYNKYKKNISFLQALRFMNAGGKLFIGSKLRSKI